MKLKYNQLLLTKMLIIDLLARAVLVIGGLNYLRFSDRYPVALVIGLSALYLAMDRDFYLPFLGKCAMPAPLGNSQPLSAGALNTYKLTNLPPNVRVVVWGAQASSGTFSNPQDAYGDYSNAVWAKSDDKGVVQVQLTAPAAYSVQRFGLWSKKLQPHIHYRYELTKHKGLFSRVHTQHV